MRLRLFFPQNTMRKFLLTLAFVFAAIVSLNAQVWIGGSVNATLNKETKTFNIAPDVGYCFSNVPLSIACAIEYEGSFEIGQAYAHSLTVSPYLRYDICDIEERFFLFVDLTADIDALEFSTFDIGLSPGVSFNISDYNWERLSEQEISHGLELNFKASAAEFGIYYNF